VSESGVHKKNNNNNNMLTHYQKRRKKSIYWLCENPRNATMYATSCGIFLFGPLLDLIITNDKRLYTWIINSAWFIKIALYCIVITSLLRHDMITLPVTTYIAGLYVVDMSWCPEKWCSILTPPLSILFMSTILINMDLLDSVTMYYSDSTIDVYQITIFFFIYSKVFQAPRLLYDACNPCAMISAIAVPTIMSATMYIILRQSENTPWGKFLFIFTLSQSRLIEVPQSDEDNIYFEILRTTVGWMGTMIINSIKSTYLIILILVPLYYSLSDDGGE